MLALPPAEITLGRILSAIDGPLALVETGRGKRTSRNSVDEGLQEVWKEVEVAIAAVLEGVTVEEMCRRVQGKDGAQDFCI